MENKELLGVEEVMKLLKLTTKDSAWKVIRDLNKELKEKGFLVRKGSVSKRYFRERYML